MDSDGDAVTSDGRLFQTRAAATPKARSPTVTGRVGARTPKRNEIAVASPRLPHGAVLVQGMVEPYHASNGRQAQRA